jgi:hypothetical protein
MFKFVMVKFFSSIEAWEAASCSATYEFQNNFTEPDSLLPRSKDPCAGHYPELD